MAITQSSLTLSLVVTVLLLHGLSDAVWLKALTSRGWMAGPGEVG